MNDNIKIIHPCIHAIGDFGKSAYICKLTNCNCKSQFFCDKEKYWRPTYQIKCPNFKDKKKVDEQPK